MSDFRRQDRDSYGEDRGSRTEEDNPPHSRLFIIGGRALTEQDFREAFSPFGEIEKVDVKPGKGITYLKFAKTSDAAEALEEMNGKSISSDPRPLKIVIASSKSQGSNREDVTALRLFLVIPKTFTEEDLRAEFNKYGPVEYVNILKDKRTQESKGLGYVKYFRFSHAAKAFENVDPSFKPKFAAPRPQAGRFDDRGSERSFGSSSGGIGVGGGFGPVHGGGFDGGFGDFGIPGSSRPKFESSIPNPTGTSRLAFMCSSFATQDKVGRLFDIIPGLEYCELTQQDPRGDRVYGSAVYNNPNSAAYALEKLHGFDYPSGSRILIKFDDSGATRMGHGGGGGGGGAGVGGGEGAAQLPAEIKTLVNTIQHATDMLNQAGYGDVVSSVPGASASNAVVFNPETMFSGELPPPQPILRGNPTSAERLFVVFKDCRGDVPAQHILNDVFSRFGNLINVYMLKGKKCGYVKYASKESAQQAIETLNEQTLCGSFLKVMIAEDSYAEKNKRARVDSEEV